MSWADSHGKRWAFTLSNAGSRYFEDRASLADLDEIDWEAVQARDWRACKEEKQAEFLMEESFPWPLIERVGVHSERVFHQVARAARGAAHRPVVEVKREWYY